MSNLQQRIITGFMLLTVLTFILRLPQDGFSGAILILSGVLYWEWWRLVPHWLGRVLGLVYVLVPMLCLLLLRLNGIEYIIYIFLVVAATDIGAFFAGRKIGGPKLAPKISPNKTWAGLLGGMVCASIFSYFFEVPYPILLGLLLALVSQMGDLFESWLKRRVGVKDSSNLLPGHGGFLDRLDGLLFAVPALYLVLHVIY